MLESWMILSKESLAIAGWNLHPVLQVWPCIVFVPSSQGNSHVVALVYKDHGTKGKATVVFHMDASDVAGMSPKLHFGQDHNRSCGKAPPQIVGCAACNLNWSFHDLSKWQAWEQLGLIYEKEQAYKDAKTGSSLSWHGHLPHLTKLFLLILTLNFMVQDAASHYEKAWEFCNEASPAVGRNPSAWQLWSSSLLWL